MRYVLIDRIVAVVPGHSLSALKNVSVSDDLVSHAESGWSVLPASMVLEAMAQGAGLLAIATTGAKAQPVLAKVQPFTSYDEAVAGDQIRIDAALEDIRPEGCRACVTASVDGRALADATVYLGFVPLDDAHGGVMRAALEEMFPEVFASSEAGARVAESEGRSGDNKSERVRRASHAIGASAPARARARVGESEGRSPSGKQ